jgi:hypothetical protein
MILTSSAPASAAEGESLAEASLRIQASPFQFGREWHNSFAKLPESSYAITALAGGNIVAVGSRVEQKVQITIGPILTCFDRNGNQIWRKVYSIFPEDIYVTLTPTGDGGFVAAGFTHKEKGALEGIEGIEGIEDIGNIGDIGGIGGIDNLDELKGMVETDGVAARFDRDGNVLWRKTFGGMAFDEFASVVAAGDGGFTVAGMRDAVMPLDKRQMRPWLIKLDALGNPQWETIYGTNREVTFSEVILCADGGFAVAGKAAQHKYSATAEPTLVNADFLLSKFDRNGKLIWTKTRNLKKDESFFSLLQTADGGFVAAGYTTPKDEDSSTSIITSFDPSGALRWSKYYGGSENSIIYSLARGADGSIVALGNSTSLNKDMEGKRPFLEKGASANTRDKRDWDYSAYVIKIDESGRKLWSSFFDNASYFNIVPHGSGGYVFLGIYNRASGGAASTLSKIPENLPAIGAISPGVCTGKAINPLPAVMFRGKTLKRNVDYTLSWANNLLPGFGSVTIRGKGAYTGVKTAYFRILPAITGGLTVKTGQKQMLVTWKKAAPNTVVEYQLRYRAKGDGGWRYRVVSGTQNAFLLKKLSTGRQYEIQVRGRKLDTGLLLAGSWSNVLTSGKVR